MNVEDVEIAKEMIDKRKRDEGTSCNLEKKKETQSPKQTSNGKRNLPSQRLSFTNFTLLIISIEQVLM